MTMLRSVTMMALACGALLVGCGDDGEVPTDGGEDAGGGDGGSPSGDGDVGGDAGPPMCPDGPCDLLTNEGCEAGQGCYFVTTMEGMAPSPMCLTAGTGGDGDECETATDCQAGFLCDTSGATSVCRHYCCTGSNVGCPTGQRCLVQLTGESGEALGVGICKLPDDCDVVEQAGCPDGEGCYPAGGGDGSVSCNLPTSDAGTQGDSCMFANACEPGFACIGDPGTCAQFCDPTADDPGCPDSTACNGLSGFPEDVGVCVGS